jgi:polysaccharide deacetylase family protein (PEP-CTERM system associated)
MRNALSVDVEDYFHVEAFAKTISYQQWDQYPSRVEGNIDRILDLFERRRVRATFFVLGWVADRHPQLVRRIAMAGHEVGCHGYAHRRIQTMTPQQFREDLRKATEQLTWQVQQAVRSYRAPSFSVVRSTMWALDILAEEGYLFDSSIFPVRHDLYGIPDAERFPHWELSAQGHQIFEFPPSTIRQAKNNLGVAGGGYLRLLPYSVTRWAIRHINTAEGQPAMVYFHPWEIDPDQPVIPAGFRSKFRHYTNLSTMMDKLLRLLQEFQFTTLSQASMAHNAYDELSMVRPATAVQPVLPARA